MGSRQSRAARKLGARKDRRRAELAEEYKRNTYARIAAREAARAAAPPPARPPWPPTLGDVLEVSAALHVPGSNAPGEDPLADLRALFERREVGRLLYKTPALGPTTLVFVDPRTIKPPFAQRIRARTPDAFDTMPEVPAAIRPPSQMSIVLQLDPDVPDGRIVADMSDGTVQVLHG